MQPDALPVTVRTNAPADETRLARAGVTPAAAAAAVDKTNRLARVRRELPIFAQLRAGVRQPVPPEVSALAREITAACKTDAERARAIYDWITSHITYDWQEWAHIVGGADAYLQPQDPASVLRRGSSVCAGYSWLFVAMADAAGLQADYVIGDVRGYRGTPDDELVSAFQHAWNAVRVGDDWYLLDATWGARQAGESSTDYLQRREYYYSTPASQMIYDHLPESESWQLLDDPLPADEFQSQPNLKPSFFQNNLVLNSPVSDTLVATPGRGGTVNLTAPDSVSVAATLSCNGLDVSEGHLAVRADGNRRQVVVAPLPSGEYLLRIYVRPAGGNAPYACAADYVVRSGAPAPATPPSPP